MSSGIIVYIFKDSAGEFIRDFAETNRERAAELAEKYNYRVFAIEVPWSDDEAWPIPQDDAVLGEVKG